MANQEDVRRIALALPETSEGDGRFSFVVSSTGKPKGYAWVWMERVHPKQARVPNPEVLAVRVPDLDVKELLLQSDGEVYFTEPHYNGFPAVLVRLPRIGVDELAHVLTQAWRCQAPRALVAGHERGAVT